MKIFETQSVGGFVYNSDTLRNILEVSNILTVAQLLSAQDNFEIN
jgi:hypothetical protein